MSSFFSTIDYLNGNIDYNSFSANRTIRKIAGSGDPFRSVADQQGAGGINADLLKLSKARIGREKSAALLTQAMSIHQDVVNQLI